MLRGVKNGTILAKHREDYAPATIRAYQSRLYLRAVPRFRHLRLAEIKRRDVQGLVDQMIEEEFASATIDGDLTALKRLYSLAIQRDEVPSSPLIGVTAPAVRCRERRVVPYAEAVQLLKALEQGDERTLWATAMFAGLRMGELSALAREDIDLATGIITVRRNWDAVEGYVRPKNRKARKVPIVAVLRDHLDEHLLRIDRDEHVSACLGSSTVRPTAPASAGRKAICRSSHCTRRDTRTPQ